MIKNEDRNVDYYKDKIIDMVKQIDDEKILQFIGDLMNSFTKKWGI